jgi:transcriptional regulator with PAS, ATPase and Fis domain
LIAATNVDPAKAVQQGKLREDLYYRINVIGIAVPPLRERTEDIPLLVENFIAEFNAQNGKAVRAVAPDAARLLRRYSWPGNIRELRN